MCVLKLAESVFSLVLEGKNMGVQICQQFETYIILITLTVEMSDELQNNFYYMPNTAINYWTPAYPQFFQIFPQMQSLNQFFPPVQQQQLQFSQNLMQMSRTAVSKPPSAEKSFEKNQVTPIARKTQQFVESTDLDYQPKKRTKKKKVASLNQNRNVLPIKIRHMLSFIVRQNRSGKIIKKLIDRQDSEVCSIGGFYAYTKSRVDTLCYHANENTLRKMLLASPDSDYIFSIREQAAYNKIIRTAFFYYLNHYSLLAALNSNRIKSAHKVEHLRIQRYLVNFMNQLSTSEGRQ